MKNVTKLEGFYVAPFTPSGELMGKGFWPFDELSEKWIKLCQEFLSGHGEVFDSSWGSELAQIETKLTSSKGAGLGVFRFRSEIAISTLYISGLNQTIDDQTRAMFVDSIERSEFVTQLSSSKHPFDRIQNISERPLAVTVVWGNPNISDEDHELIQELSTHFAAAFFLSAAEG